MTKAWKTMCDPTDGPHVPVLGGDPCLCEGEPAPWGLCPHEGRPFAFQMMFYPDAPTALGSARVVCLTCGEVQ